MGLNSPITVDNNWVRYEHKFIGVKALTAAGQDDDLTGLSLVFYLVRQRGDTSILLEKTSGAGQITLVGANHNIAKVEILPTDYGNLPGGTYFYTFWDVTDELAIAFGDAVIQESGPLV